MEKLMNPLFLAVVALALVASLQFGLYIMLHLEVGVMRKSFSGKLNSEVETKDSLRSEVLRISEELGTLNTAAPSQVTIGQSMNLSRRNQVLRMHLRGDSPSRIAGVLKISKNEVDLLLKVHRTVLPPSAWSASATTPDSRRVGVFPQELIGELEQGAANLHAN